MTKVDEMGECMRHAKVMTEWFSSCVRPMSSVDRRGESGRTCQVESSLADPEKRYEPFADRTMSSDVASVLTIDHARLVKDAIARQPNEASSNFEIVHANAALAHANKSES